MALVAEKATAKRRRISANFSLRKGQAEMSIMPEGGWEDPPRQDTQPKQESIQRAPTIHPPQTAYLPRSSCLICKVCDRGSLSPKKKFRLSGPVVAIGFILLIPSILGIVVSAIMLIGVNSVSLPHQTHQSAEDAKFRKACKDAFVERQAQFPAGISDVTAPQFCECTLSAYKATGSVDVRGASETCAQQGVNGTLKQPDQSVDVFYEDASSQSAEETGANVARFIGSGFAIAMGIASFVGGLLGWLLVMRKRVLQCNVCGAVVNAS
jgi:hypothetical protein